MNLRDANLHILISFHFRYPSTDSNEDCPSIEENGTRISRLGSSDIWVPNDTGGLEEDTFLAHLESQSHSNASNSPQK